MPPADAAAQAAAFSRAEGTQTDGVPRYGGGGEGGGGFQYPSALLPQNSPLAPTQGPVNRGGSSSGGPVAPSPTQQQPRGSPWSRGGGDPERRPPFDEWVLSQRPPPQPVLQFQPPPPQPPFTAGPASASGPGAFSSPDYEAWVARHQHRWPQGQQQQAPQPQPRLAYTPADFPPPRITVPPPSPYHQQQHGHQTQTHPHPHAGPQYAHDQQQPHPSHAGRVPSAEAATAALAHTLPPHRPQSVTWPHDYIVPSTPIDAARAQHKDWLPPSLPSHHVTQSPKAAQRAVGGGGMTPRVSAPSPNPYPIRVPSPPPYSHPLPLLPDPAPLLAGVSSADPLALRRGSSSSAASRSSALLDPGRSSSSLRRQAGSGSGTPAAGHGLLLQPQQQAQQQAQQQQPFQYPQPLQDQCQPVVNLGSGVWPGSGPGGGLPPRDAAALQWTMAGVDAAQAHQPSGGVPGPSSSSFPSPRERVIDAERRMEALRAQLLHQRERAGAGRLPAAAGGGGGGGGGGAPPAPVAPPPRSRGRGSSSSETVLWLRVGRGRGLRIQVTAVHSVMIPPIYSHWQARTSPGLATELATVSRCTGEGAPGHRWRGSRLPA
jgi:hypothetical protein